MGNNGVDFCGVCGGQSLTNDPYCGLTSSTSCCDCNGTPYGDAIVDECDICGGDNSSCNQPIVNNLDIETFEDTPINFLLMLRTQMRMN